MNFVKTAVLSLIAALILTVAPMGSTLLAKDNTSSVIHKSGNFKKHKKHKKHKKSGKKTTTTDSKDKSKDNKSKNQQDTKKK